jgi:hypothetical protein
VGIEDGFVLKVVPPLEWTGGGATTPERGAATPRGAPPSEPLRKLECILPPVRTIAERNPDREQIAAAGPEGVHAETVTHWECGSVGV